MSIHKLSDNNLNEVTGGQLYAENVLGIDGLWCCTGAPTEKNPEGLFWHMGGNGLDDGMTTEEAVEIMKSKGKLRELNEEESFLHEYLDGLL